MSERGHLDDTGVEQVIAENYASAEMSDVFRRELLARTRSRVAGRSRGRRRWWSMCFAGVAVSVLVALLVWQFAFVAPGGGERRAESRERRVGSEGPSAMGPNRSVRGPEPREGNAGGSRDLAVQRPPSGGDDQQPGQDVVANRGDDPVDDPSELNWNAARPRVLALAVTAADQPVTDQAGSALRAGDRIASGARIRTGVGGRVTLVTRRGSRVDLDSNSEVTIGSDRAVLLSGRLYCSNRDSEIDRIDTSAGSIELLGTALDAAVLKEDAVAVTVVEGKVKLANSHGGALVAAGRRSVLTAALPPQEGAPVNTFAVTAWCDRRGVVQSDFGDLTYTVDREKYLVTEVWAMNGDGTGRRRVRSYIGGVVGLGPWLPGAQWLLAETVGPALILPDLHRRLAVSGIGEDVMKKQKWFLNSITGQDLPMRIPTRLKMWTLFFAPDCTRFAFTGEDHYQPGDWTKVRRGVWTYDLRTGETTPMLENVNATTLAWSPDGRRMIVSVGDEKKMEEWRLVLVDTQTLEVRDLKLFGMWPSVSPDGTKLVCCRIMALDSSSAAPRQPKAAVFVKDLDSESEPRQVTPDDAWAWFPCWSPDGTRILYYHSGAGLCTMGADGSGVTIVCPESQLVGMDIMNTVGWSPCLAWSPDGRGVYLSTRKGVLLYAADGSGLKANLSENNGGGTLSVEEQAQTDAAVAALQEAFFHYCFGSVLTYEGRAVEGRQAYATAADIFAGLMYDYPLAGFGGNDVLRYADKAARLAARTDEYALMDACWDHMRILRAMFSNWDRHKSLPVSLAQMEEWAVTKRCPGISRILWFTGRDTEHVRMTFRCPASPEYAPVPYIYSAPGPGALPELGTEILRCPIHGGAQLIYWGNRNYSNPPVAGPTIWPPAIDTTEWSAPMRSGAMVPGGG